MPKKKIIAPNEWEFVKIIKTECAGDVVIIVKDSDKEAHDTMLEFTCRPANLGALQFAMHYEEDRDEGYAKARKAFESFTQEKVELLVQDLLESLREDLELS